MSDELENGTEVTDETGSGSTEGTQTPTTSETNSESTTEEETTSTVKDEPKLVIHNEDCIFMHDFEPCKYKNCFTSGDCAYKRITMPEGYVNEEDIKSDFAV